jgi:hypothetical protein
VNADQQPTTQTALAATTSSYWHPAARDNELRECAQNRFHPACSQRSGTAGAVDCDFSHTPAADSGMPSYTFIAPPDVHTDYTQQPFHCRGQRIQRPTLAAYSLTSQARNSNEVWPQLSTELQTKPLPAQNALLAMSHRPQEVKALCSNAAISLPPCIHLSCRHHFPVTRQAVELPAVTQQHLSLPLTDVSNTASRYCSQETYMRLLPTMTQCIQNRRLAQMS